MAMSSALSAVRLVAVGSANPVKVSATRAVVARIAPDASIQSIAVPSGVSDQPWGDEETIRGAVARAHAARSALDADIGVGIEGGVVDEGDGVRTCAWAAIVSRDGREGIGGSLSMQLPANVARAVRDGLELGHAMDAYSGRENVKQGVGAVGILTGGLVTRQQAYEVIVAYAIGSL
jgi:inosine/xanthosine triphosphatase